MSTSYLLTARQRLNESNEATGGGRLWQNLDRTRRGGVPS